MQRGLDPNVRHRETIPTRRYIRNESGSVCVAAGGVTAQSGKTACYSDHSQRRKYCKLLTTNETMLQINHPPGLYVNGLPPYHTEALFSMVCDDDSDDESDDETRVPPTVANKLILGPYHTSRDEIRIKCVDFESVFAEHKHPENVATRFYGSFGSNDRTIPSVAMMAQCKELLQKHGIQRNPSSRVKCNNFIWCTDALLERTATMRRLAVTCNRRPDLQRAARRLLRNLFFFTMYSRRWAGPGTPYPISAAETRRNVGQRNKPVSEELHDMTVTTSAIGDVILSENGGGGADTVRDGKVTSMLDAYFLAVHNCVDAIPSAADRTLLKNAFMVAIPLHDTNGSCWPSHELVWDLFFSPDSRSVAQGQLGGSDRGTCIRQVSHVMVYTCTMMETFLYKTTPQWMKYEGGVGEIQ